MNKTDVRHVLFDADGVLQSLPGGWYAAVAPFLGDSTEKFLRAAWDAEVPMLTEGGDDYLGVLADLLDEHGATASVDEVYAAVWNAIVTNPESAEIVRRVRAAGYGVHLGTNQAAHRSELMRTTLGYDDLFDVSCYSYELGVAKPKPEFFLRCAQRIGADPHQVLFVDDSARNIEAARSVGMAAVHWSFDLDKRAEHTGHPALVTQLAVRGVHL